MADFDQGFGFQENNYEEIDKEVYLAYRKRQQKLLKTRESEFLDEVIKANDINKRVIGKVMVTYCGNEGAEHDERTSSLRKLLQAVIDYIQVHPKVNWHNAEVTVYDIDDNSFRITSGEGKHQYIVSDDGAGGVEIFNTSNKIHKAPKPSSKDKQQRDHPYDGQHERHPSRHHESHHGKTPRHSEGHRGHSRTSHHHGGHGEREESNAGCILC